MTRTMLAGSILGRGCSVGQPPKRGLRVVWVDQDRPRGVILVTKRRDGAEPIPLARAQFAADSFDVVDEPKKSNDVLEVAVRSPGLIGTNFHGERAGDRRDRQVAPTDAHDLDGDRSTCFERPAAARDPDRRQRRDGREVCSRAKVIGREEVDQIAAAHEPMRMLG
jgi:hypothetical protein